MKSSANKAIIPMNAFLCLCVVLIHLTSVPLGTLNPDGIKYAWIFVINRIPCFCVPSFIFLSGFKLFSGYGEKKIELKRFFKGRLVKIVVPYVIAVLIYFIYFLLKNWVRISELPQYIFLGTLVAHFYYIIIAVQCYILFPLIKNLFNRHPVWISVIALMSTVCFNEFVKVPYSDRFVGTYIFYFVLGMLFKKYDLGEKIRKYYVIGVIGYVVVAVIHIRLFYVQASGLMIYRWASIVNILYVVLSIVVIYGASMWISEKAKFIFNASKAVGDVSYNVYLYHILIMQILQYDILAGKDIAPATYFWILSCVVYGAIVVYTVLNYIIKRKKECKA